MANNGEEVSDSSTGSRKPSDIFTAEIWQTIFKKLADDPRDILNIAAASSSFDKLIDKNSFKLAEVLPLVIRFLDKECILNCRVVSFGVRKSVDKILDEVGRMAPKKSLNLHPRLTKPESAAAQEWSRFKNLARFEVKIDSVPTLDQLLQFIRSSAEIWSSEEDERPLVGKKLNLSLTTDLNKNVEADVPRFDDILLDATLSSLANHQNKISYLHVDMGYRITNVAEVYSTIQKLLCGFPSLRSFSGRFYRFGLTTTVDPFCYNIQMEYQLQDFIEQNPLPRMASLEDFSLHNYRMPVPFYEQIAEKYGSQLKTLDIGSSYETGSKFVGGFMDTEFSSNNMYHFPTLLELKIDTSWETRGIFLMMQAPSLKSFAWMLYCPFDKLRQVTDEELKKVVENFPTARKEQLLVCFC